MMRTWVVVYTTATLGASADPGATASNSTRGHHPTETSTAELISADVTSLPTDEEVAAALADHRASTTPELKQHWDGQLRELLGAPASRRRHLQQNRRFDSAAVSGR
jgi:hypothetical protein